MTALLLQSLRRGLLGGIAIAAVAGLGLTASITLTQGTGQDGGTGAVGHEASLRSSFHDSTDLSDARTARAIVVQAALK